MSGSAYETVGWGRFPLWGERRRLQEAEARAREEFEQRWAHRSKPDGTPPAAAPARHATRHMGTSTTPTREIYGKAGGMSSLSEKIEHWVASAHGEPTPGMFVLNSDGDLVPVHFKRDSAVSTGYRLALNAGVSTGDEWVGPETLRWFGPEQQKTFVIVGPASQEFASLLEDSSTETGVETRQE